MIDTKRKMINATGACKLICKHCMNRTNVLILKFIPFFRKSLFEVETDIFLVGKGEEVKASIHDFNGEIHLRHPFNDGKFVRYQRALVRGQMIHSKSYQKVTQRNSYTVLYNNDGEDQFGEVLCFGFIEDFYTKNSHNYAFVLPFHEININIVNDNTTGKVTEGLHIFRKER